MTAPPRISGDRTEPVMGPADAGFVSGLTAFILPIVREPDREEMIFDVLKSLRPHLSSVPQILGMALCFDAMVALNHRSEGWRQEYEDLRRRITDFNEWRLGRAQEALMRRQD